MSGSVLLAERNQRAVSSRMRESLFLKTCSSLLLQVFCLKQARTWTRRFLQSWERLSELKRLLLLNLLTRFGLLKNLLHLNSKLRCYRFSSRYKPLCRLRLQNQLEHQELGVATHE